MTILQYVEKALKNAKKALKVSEMVKPMQDAGWSTKSPNPSQPIRSKLYLEVQTKGVNSNFVLVGPGTFNLRNNSQQSRVKKSNDNRTNTVNDKAQNLSFTECAVRVLRDSGGALHPKKITTIATKQGWLKSKGKFPEATMNTLVIREIDRYIKRGRQPRFFKDGVNIGLTEWMNDNIASMIVKHNSDIRKALLKQLRSMNPYDFEFLIGQLLVRMGFEDVEVTNYVKDNGIDIQATFVGADTIRISMCVQVKRYKNNIGSPAIQQTRGALKCVYDRGLVVTTSNFTPSAIIEANRQGTIPISLINGDKLIDLMMEYEMGVNLNKIELFELVNDDTVE